jgi:hypothetical protein
MIDATRLKAKWLSGTAQTSPLIYKQHTQKVS